MNTKIDTDKLKESVDLREHAGQHVALRSVTHDESAGPCPKCGGDDRFHCTADWFFCRQCHTERGDAIEFEAWLNSADFVTACNNLGAEVAQTAHRRPAQPTKPAKPAQDDKWRARALGIVTDAIDTLWTSDIAMDYLRGRHLDSSAWLTYRLGYVERSPTAERAPAIVIPWYRGGQIAAVRFRFTDTQHTTDKAGNHHATKAKSLKGSLFTGLLYGGQAGLESGIGRTLVICEGELNAMSIWQVAQASRLDVLSIGSESARLTPAMVAHAKKYGTILAWADRPGVAQRQAIELGADAVSSPGGKDANDMLLDGSLGYALSFWRYQMATTKEQRQSLLRAFEAGARKPGGQDDGTIKIIGKLREELGNE